MLRSLVGSEMCIRDRTSTTSGYKPITTKTVSDGSIFDLPVELECTAGSGKKGSPYAKGLTPGVSVAPKSLSPVKLVDTKLRMESADL